MGKKIGIGNNRLELDADCSGGTYLVRGRERLHVVVSLSVWMPVRLDQRKFVLCEGAPRWFLTPSLYQRDVVGLSSQHPQVGVTLAWMQFSGHEAV